MLWCGVVAKDRPTRGGGVAHRDSTIGEVGDLHAIVRVAVRRTDPPHVAQVELRKSG